MVHKLCIIDHNNNSINNNSVIFVNRSDVRTVRMGTEVVVYLESHLH